MFCKRSLASCLVAVSWLLSVVFVPLLVAQEKPPAGTMTKEQQEMMAAMEKAATPGPNHKMLETLVGNWDFTNRFWMDPAGPPSESKGTVVYEMALGGRFLHGHYKGDMMGMAFEGVGATGYDNLTKRFQAVWMDNMTTGIMMATGTYDPAAKAITFRAEVDDPMKPGTKVKVREVLRIPSPDKHMMEWYEVRGGKEIKTMEIVYTRKK